MKSQLIMVLAVILLTAGICSADNYVGGITSTTIKESEVSGGVYFDSYYGTGVQEKYNPITIEKPFTPVALSAPIVGIEPMHQEVLKGDIFTVNITVDPQSVETMAAQYYLYFNNTLLNATGQTEGDFLSRDGASANTFANKINNNIGIIEYGESRINVDYGTTTPSVLATITFHVIAECGVCEFLLDDFILSNPSAQEIPDIIVNNGSVEVICSSEPDLLVSDIKVKHNYYNGAWVDLSNSVDVTVANNGAGGAGSFNVALYVDCAEVETMSVSGLASGVNTVVSFDWTPDEVKTYTLKAEVDPDNTVAESDETNNELTKSQDVGYNGYVGDKPLTTYAHETITGNITYTYGDSKYSGKLYPDDTYTVNHDITLPAGATVKFARLYSYWTWSATGTTGKYPVMSLAFDGSTLSPDIQYDDRKGWGSAYDFPAGTWAYNVTGLVTGSGAHTTVVTNTDTDSGAFFCMDGLGLLVVYEDQNGQVVEYWINEGADFISTQKPASGGLTPEEATVTSLFQGSVDLSNVDSARLWTVVQSGGDMNNKLLFNDMNWTGVYDSTPYPDLDIDEARAVEDYLKTSDNIAQISGAPYPPGDYLMPSNAFLVITYSGVPSPKLSISADPTTVTVGVPTDVTFTVTNNSVPVEGVPITLSGHATGSGTTGASGAVVISVNATGEGTIISTASKEGFTSASTTLTAESEHEGVSSSVSMSVEIRPAISLVVTPGSIDFGELAPGETSGVNLLTLGNTGGFNIDVTADVTDTADDLFVNGLLLDSAGWSAYETSIVAAGSDTADAALEVPGNYVGVGAKEGTIVFWAQKA